MMGIASAPHIRSAAPLQIGELLNPEAFTHPVSQLEVRETVISWIILTGSVAYKIKKPVSFDFIDAATLDRRRHYCQEELRLNRRLAPDLYLNVVPIARVDGRARVGDASGPAIEYAVCMKQFDRRQELTRLLQNADVARSEIEDLARCLAQFHLRAPASTSSGVQDNTEHLYDAVSGNMSQLLGHLEQLGPDGGLRQLVDWTHDTARALESCFRSREQSGYVRECHGDLHSANIVRYEGRLVPFDCIDFDPRLRWIDVINDIAFLAMDLVSHRRDDLACVLLSSYLEVTGDYEGMRLLPFCAVYRALVRAKVDAIAAEQSAADATELRRRLRQRLQTAVHWMERPRPTLILMHGPSGSGKSWLSERLVSALPAVRIRSDLERKRLAGMTPETRAAALPDEGIYHPQMSHRTYARLLESAESCLQAGINLIVDAAFLGPADRELFRGLARRLRVPFLIASCQADSATLRTRLALRARERNNPSDAGQLVLQTQLRDFRPLDSEAHADSVIVDTREPGAVRRVVAAVAART